MSSYKRNQQTNELYQQQHDAEHPSKMIKVKDSIFSLLGWRKNAELANNNNVNNSYSSSSSLRPQQQQQQHVRNTPISRQSKNSAYTPSPSAGTDQSNASVYMQDVDTTPQLSFLQPPKIRSNMNITSKFNNNNDVSKSSINNRTFQSTSLANNFNNSRNVSGLIGNNSFSDRSALDVLSEYYERLQQQNGYLNSALKNRNVLDDSQLDTSNIPSANTTNLANTTLDSQINTTNNNNTSARRIIQKKKSTRSMRRNDINSNNNNNNNKLDGQIRENKRKADEYLRDSLIKVDPMERSLLVKLKERMEIDKYYRSRMKYMNYYSRGSSSTSNGQLSQLRHAKLSALSKKNTNTSTTIKSNTSVESSSPLLKKSNLSSSPKTASSSSSSSKPTAHKLTNKDGMFSATLEYDLNEDDDEDDEEMKADTHVKIETKSIMDKVKFNDTKSKQSRFSPISVPSTFDTLGKMAVRPEDKKPSIPISLETKKPAQAPELDDIKKSSVSVGPSAGFGFNSKPTTAPAIEANSLSTPINTTTSGNLFKTAENDDKPKAKTADEKPRFGFGSTLPVKSDDAKPASSTSTSNGFSFNKPAASSTTTSQPSLFAPKGSASSASSEKSTSKPLFGATTNGSDTTPAPVPASVPSFSFGNATTATSSDSKPKSLFGSSSNDSAKPTVPSFSFGGAKPAEATGAKLDVPSFTLNGSSESEPKRRYPTLVESVPDPDGLNSESSKTTKPALCFNTGASSSSSSFKFGEKPAAPSSTGASAPAPAAAAPKPSFSFGKPAASGSASDAKPAETKPFSFAAPSTSVAAPESVKTSESKPFSFGGSTAPASTTTGAFKFSTFGAPASSNESATNMKRRAEDGDESNGGAKIPTNGLIPGAKPSLFGSTAGSQPSLFGGISDKKDSTTAPAAGSTGSTGFSFGAPSAAKTDAVPALDLKQPTPSMTKTPSLFGNATLPAFNFSGSASNGATPANPTATTGSTTSLFGAKPVDTEEANGNGSTAPSLFSGSKPTSTAAGGFSFTGGASSTAPKPLGFGATNTATSSLSPAPGSAGAPAAGFGGFANGAANASTTTGAFGANQLPSMKSTGGFSFSAPNGSTPAAAPGKPSFNFNSGGGAPSAAGIFGGASKGSNGSSPAPFQFNTNGQSAFGGSGSNTRESTPGFSNPNKGFGSSNPDNKIFGSAALGGFNSSTFGSNSTPSNGIGMNANTNQAAPNGNSSFGGFNFNGGNNNNAGSSFNFGGNGNGNGQNSSFSFGGNASNIDPASIFSASATPPPMGSGGSVPVPGRKKLMPRPVRRR